MELFPTAYMAIGNFDPQGNSCTIDREYFVRLILQEVAKILSNSSLSD